MDHKDPILQTLKYHTSDVTSVDFGGNFLLATGSSDKTVRVWEWKVGLGFVDVPYSPLPPHKYGVTWVKFSPQGTMLASSSVDGTTILWSVKTGAKIHTMVQSTRCSVRRFVFTPDSTKLITAGDDGVFCFWDLIHRTHIRNHFLHDDEDSSVQGVAVTPDSEYLVTGDTSGLVKLWALSDVNVEELQCLFYVKNVHDGIGGLDFSPCHNLSGTDIIRHKYLLSTSGCDGNIKLWDVVVKRSSKQVESDYVKCNMSVRMELTGHQSDVHNVKFNSTGCYLTSTGLDKTVRVWQVEDGECIETWSGHTRYGNCSVFSRDSTLIASGSNDKSVIIWDIGRNVTLDTQLVKQCSALNHFNNNHTHSNKISEHFVVQQAEHDGNKVELVQTLQFAAGVNCCQFHDSNMLAVAGGDKVVSVYSRLEDKLFWNEEMSPLEGHKYSINQLEISPCGSYIISCSMDGVVIFWNVKLSSSYELRAPPCTASVRTCRFSPDGKLIAAAGDDEIVFLWDVSSMEFIRTLQQHKDAVTSVAFSPDTKLIASTCCAGALKIWNLDMDECTISEDNVHDLGALSSDFSFNAFTNDKGDKDYLLATSGNDSGITVWQVKQYELLKWNDLSGHGGNVMFVRFSPTAPYILVSSATDNTARLWNVKSGDCLHVLENHESMVTCCCFSHDSTYLATGSLDKTVLVWLLPVQLASDTTSVIQQSYENRRKILNWTSSDVGDWLCDLGMTDLGDSVRENSAVTGRQLLCLPISDLLDLTKVDETDRDELSLQLFWLKKETKQNPRTVLSNGVEIPHEFLCPITHEIMYDPVTCLDGFTYERSAIREWFLSGRIASPMTNEPMSNPNFKSNISLKREINTFLYGDTVVE